MPRKLKPVPAVVVSNGSTALVDGLMDYFITTAKEELQKLPPVEQAKVIEKLCEHFKPNQG